ncbi:hypothetical protein ACLB2K_063151 [Fragaria x ananassa]
MEKPPQKEKKNVPSLRLICRKRRTRETVVSENSNHGPWWLVSPSFQTHSPRGKRGGTVGSAIRFTRSPNSNELETYVQQISNSVEGRKFLLVLDDAWDSDHRKWEPFLTTLQCGAIGSKILLTTRIAQVASAIGTTSGHTIHLQELSEETCRSLFYHIAFFDGARKESKKFEDIGNKIVKRCKGLPLAAKTLGSLMRYKNTIEQWVDVLNSKIWEIQEVEQQVFRSSLLSYYDLEPLSKRCVLYYCATFSKHYEIDKDYLNVKGGNIHP